MKVLKKILAAVMLLTAMLCALILLCAVNPEMSANIGRVMNGQTKDIVKTESVSLKQPKQDSLSAEKEPEEAAEAEPLLTEKEESDGHQPDAPQIEIEKTVQRGLGGYAIPDDVSVKAPEAVAGKSGYQPITETSVELEGAEGGEYTSAYGYGETGDGMTFDAELYPYYQMLDEKGKHLYRQIYANALALYQEFVPIEAVPVSEVRNVVESVYNDHPELFWLNTAFTCKYDQNKICAELSLEFNDLTEDLDGNSIKLGNEANRILTQVQNLGTEQEIEKAIHDILIAEVEYDKGADVNQSVYSAMVNKKSVCAGYARALQYLMQRLGIPCYYCTGYTGEDHAWNIVKLGDSYYNVDVTWDDTPGGEYDYYNKTDQEFSDTHVRQSLAVNLPGCETENKTAASL